MEEETKQIEDAFFIPSFQTITNIDKSNATATEIIAREREALISISPAISRIEDEWLEPLLTQVFEICQRQGLLPEPPVELSEGQSVRLEFTGVLSSAPKLTESVAALNFFQEFGVMLEFMPEDERVKAMNGLNYQNIIKTLMDNRNLPVDFRKSETEMEDKAKQDQLAQENAMLQQQITEMAKSQDLTKAPEQGSPMEGMM